MSCADAAFHSSSTSFRADGHHSTIPPEAPSYRSGRRIAAIAADLGIRTLDPWDVLRPAVQRDGSSRYFLGDSDIHFKPEGHRLMADWLAEHLPPPPP